MNTKEHKMSQVLSLFISKSQSGMMIHRHSSQKDCNMKSACTRSILFFAVLSATGAALLSTPRLTFVATKTARFGKRGNGKVEKKERIQKLNLPEKICVACGRPFTWRKKWERSWDEVTCCSRACNAKRKADGFVGQEH
jgi:hypothetical protein